jgi:hypothetical protein
VRIIALLALLSLPATADVSPKRPAGKGWIWIAEQDTGTITALDRADRIVWSHKGLGSIRDFSFTRRGTILAGGLDHDVREISLDGKVLWEYKAPDGVYAVRQLSNGNILVGCHRQVIEVKRDGTIVWEYANGMSCPEDMQVLPKDQLLVGWYGGGRVEVVDRDKRVLREVAGGSPMGVQMLGDGRILICDVREQRVRLINAAGESDWEYLAGDNTPHATMTKSGDVLVSTWGSIRRVNRAGKVVWTRDGLRRAIKVREW